MMMLNVANRDKLILYVEDDLTSQKFVKRSINTFYNIVGFTDPVNALGFFKRNKENILLVIADEKMPRLKGHELLAKINKIKKIPIMIFSAYRKDEIRDNCIVRGICPSIFPKPLSSDLILRKIKESLITAYGDAIYESV